MVPTAIVPWVSSSTRPCRQVGAIAAARRSTATHHIRGSEVAGTTRGLGPATQAGLVADTLAQPSVEVHNGMGVVRACAPPNGWLNRGLVLHGVGSTGCPGIRHGHELAAFSNTIVGLSRKDARGRNERRQMGEISWFQP